MYFFFFLFGTETELGEKMKKKLCGLYNADGNICTKTNIYIFYKRENSKENIKKKIFPPPPNQVGRLYILPRLEYRGMGGDVYFFKMGFLC